MKNVTLSFVVGILAFTGLSAQTYSSGTVTLFSDYTGKVDVTSTTVTVTLIGPSTAWLGMGFDATSMDDVGMDAVIFDGTNMTDRTFNGVGVIPPLDATQNWSVSSNTINTGVRTVVATRARDTGDANDYVFTAAAAPLNIIFARRTGSLVIGYHGGGNCGATTLNLTLGTDSFVADSFKMYPNPSKGNLTVELPKNVSIGNIKIYDNLGRVVRKQTVSTSENTIDTSDLTSGTYIVVLRTDYGNATQNLVID
ncbi:MAG: T9SS type A sorting domain-containing protein [Flavobacterium sp.]